MKLLAIILLLALPVMAQVDPELARLIQTLPDNHKINGVTVGQWKQAMAQPKAPLGFSTVNRIMSWGPKPGAPSSPGVVPQTIFGVLGAIFLHDFVKDNMHRDPETGEYLPLTAWEERYPEAANTLLFFRRENEASTRGFQPQYTERQSTRRAPQYNRVSDTGVNFRDLPGVE